MKWKKNREHSENIKIDWEKKRIEREREPKRFPTSNNRTACSFTVRWISCSARKTLYISICIALVISLSHHIGYICDGMLCLCRCCTFGSAYTRDVGIFSFTYIASFLFLDLLSSIAIFPFVYSKHMTGSGVKHAQHGNILRLSL